MSKMGMGMSLMWGRSILHLCTMIISCGTYMCKYTGVSHLYGVLFEKRSHRYGYIFWWDKYVYVIYGWKIIPLISVMAILCDKVWLPLMRKASTPPVTALCVCICGNICAWGSRITIKICTRTHTPVNTHIQGSDQACWSQNVTLSSKAIGLYLQMQSIQGCTTCIGHSFTENPYKYERICVHIWCDKCICLYGWNMKSMISVMKISRGTYECKVYKDVPPILGTLSLRISK